jgi:hypothetical protein
MYGYIGQDDSNPKRTYLIKRPANIQSPGLFSTDLNSAGRNVFSLVQDPIGWTAPSLIEVGSARFGFLQPVAISPVLRPCLKYIITSQ